MKKLSWDPVSSGGVYCAPACGRDCTKEEHDRACGAAIRMTQNLGLGWTMRVWENLGWHHEAISSCGRIKVSPTANGYVAFLGSPDSDGGRWAECGDSPREAIDAVIAVARAELAEVGAVLGGL